MRHQRTCIGCRVVKPREELVRVVAPGGGLKVDKKGVLGGRGAYLCPVRGCVEEALRRKDVFSRALRTRVETPEPESFIKEVLAGC